MSNNNAKLYKCYKGTCSKCLNEENPYITEDEYKDLLDSDGKIQCPEGHLDCGIQELKPEDYPSPPKDRKKIFLLGGAILTVLIICGAIFFLLKSCHPEKKSDSKNDTLVVVLDEKKQADLKKHIADSIETLRIIDSTKNAQTKFIEPVTSGTSINTQQPIKKKTIVLNNGDKYEGDIKGEKMNGQGTFYYKTRQLISPKDRKKRYAEAGDYIIGEWFAGNLVQGKLFASDGHQKDAIMIGR